MNGRLLILTLKGLARRWKNVLRVSVAVILSFAFVTGILLFQENMYNWQIANAKKHFGDWFVMDIVSEDTQNAVLASFPYLDKAVTAKSVNEVYDEYEESTGIMVGNMSGEFVEHNNITVEQGRMPEKTDEIAVEWNSLLKLNQSYNIGDSIELIFVDSKSETGYTTRNYTLSGILTSYTNVWVNGKVLPGVIMCEEELDNIKRSERIIYCYPLKSFVKEDDYRLIYNRICDDAKSRRVGYFNEAVYEIKPWGNQFLYQYMYVLVMIIGIASITYQMLSYNKSRKNVRDIQKQLGAGRGQRFGIFFTENVIIILISAVIGTVIAVLAGRIICNTLFANGTIDFFRVGSKTYIKTAFTLVMAVIISSVTGLFGSRKRSVGTTKKYRFRRKISVHNIVGETSKRLIKSNGAVINIFIRLFSLAMGIIIAVCVISAASAYNSYLSNNSSADIVGYINEEDSIPYFYFYLCDNDKYWEFINENPHAYESEKYEYTRLEPNHESFSNFRYMKRFEWTKKIKCGKTNLFTEISDKTINSIKGISGVEKLSFGYYETNRSWTWDGMDMKKLGSDSYNRYDNTEAPPSSNGKYLFASEYVDANQEIYELICRYAGDSAMSYEDFKNGDVAVVFEDANSKGLYDDTMKDGITLNLSKYYTSILYDGSYSWDGGDTRYSDELYRYALTTILFSNTYEDKYKRLINQDLVDYYTSRLSKEDVIQLLSEYDEYSISFSDSSVEKVADLCDDLKNNRITLEEFYNIAHESYRYFVAGLYYYQLMYDNYFVPAASTKVAKVITLNDEIKNAFREYIPEFGQYTMLASTSLAEKAIDNQNELVKRYFVTDELPLEITLKLVPNQISVTYGLESAFTATNNIVASYFGQAGLTYNSFSEEKEQLKQKTIEAIILYGFSAIAAMVVYILVSVVVLCNRLDKYKNRLTILKQTGADKKVLIRICMVECVREALWCVWLLPLMLIIDYVIVRKRV